MGTPQSGRRSWALLLAAIGAGGLAFATTAAAVEVRGSLDVPKDLSDQAADEPATHEPYWEEWNGVLDPKDPTFEPARELAVVLTGSGSADPDGCEYALRGGDFAPRTIVAKGGSTLRIKNTDGCSHELHADMEGFAPLQTAPGNARTVTLPGEGHWVVRDKRYPHVEGHLHAVKDLVACGAIAADGKFTFENVEPGTYTLAVYHDAEQVASQQVEIEEGGTQTLEPIALSAKSD
ncbi:MAG: hypothetical protein ACOCUS_05030 [Polyangiales bacterium]